ncbi:hypothetical protein BDC45DRAFT_510934 [Circinella umbellata]|nr:hypothetical protein BDC45DRAFT_510934 [Circinella umbellata]
MTIRNCRRKAQWYLVRELATIKDNEERAIQLNFEAKGQGHAEDDYMVEDRDNFCVICGSTDSLTLHHVVPYVYRQWFPLTIKSKSSRDLLLVCKHCHDQYERYATSFKKNLATKYELPLEGKGWVRVPENRTARKAASALLRAADKLPPQRKQELETIVKDFWERKKQEISTMEAIQTIKKDKEEKEACNDDESVDWQVLDWQEVLQKCCELQELFQGPDFIEHGQGVVRHLMVKETVDDNNGKERWPDLEDFVKEWRQHFLDHSKPKHLSERWTVDGEIYTH